MRMGIIPLIFLIIVKAMAPYSLALSIKIKDKHLKEADKLAAMLVDGKYQAYVDALLREFNSLQPDFIRAKALIYNELAEVYARRLLNAEQALKYNLLLKELLENGSFNDVVDGYGNLPMQTTSSQGKAYQVAHPNYIKRYRNPDHAALSETAQERAQFIKILLAEGDLDLFTWDSPKDKSILEEKKRKLEDPFSPIGERAREGVYLAGVYANQGNWDLGLAFASLALSLADGKASFPLLDEMERMRACYVLYLCLKEKGAYKDADKYLRQSIALLNKVRDRYATEKQRVIFFRHLERLIDKRVFFLLEQKKVLPALLALESRKSRVLKEMMDQRRFEVESGFQPELDPIDGKATGLTRGKPLKSNKTIRDKLIPLPESNAMEVLIDRGGAKGSDLGVKPGDIVVSYFLEPDRMTAWVIASDAPIFCVRHKVPEFALDKVQTFWANQMTIPSMTGDPEQELLAYMHELISKPLLDALEKMGIDQLEEKKLVISPFGTLSNLPMHAFYDSNARHYLFQKFARWIYTPSAKIYHDGKSKTVEKPYHALAVGIGLFANLPKLENAPQEAIKIAEMMQPSQKLINEMAVKSEVLKGFNTANIVHLATHAHFFQERPTCSTIYLHKTETHSNMQAFEFLEWDLSKKMFVLSACQTGKQKPASGDDLFGMERYLLAAGAVAIVSSLWSVNDPATRDYMEGFYSWLNQGHEPSEAWKKATEQALDQHKSPFFWAPFKITAFR